MKKVFLSIALLILILISANSYTQNKSFKIAVVQIKGKFADKEYNINKLYNITLSCATSGAYIIVLPELGTTSYKSDKDFWRNSEMIEPYAEKIPGYTTKLFSQIALKYKCYIIIGMVEKGDKKYELYNSQCVINPQGTIETVYRKINLYKYDEYWANTGNYGYQTFDTIYGRFGLLICYDMHFENPVKYLLNNGVSYILFSSAWDDEKPIERYWQRFALNNNIYFFASNGSEAGESCIISRDGAVIKSMSKLEAGFIIAEITSDITTN